MTLAALRLDAGDRYLWTAGTRRRHAAVRAMSVRVVHGLGWVVSGRVGLGALKQKY